MCIICSLSHLDICFLRMGRRIWMAELKRDTKISKEKRRPCLRRDVVHTTDRKWTTNVTCTWKKKENGKFFLTFFCISFLFFLLLTWSCDLCSAQRSTVFPIRVSLFRSNVHGFLNVTASGQSKEDILFTKILNDATTHDYFHFVRAWVSQPLIKLVWVVFFLLKLSTLCRRLIYRLLSLVQRKALFNTLVVEASGFPSFLTLRHSP